jgi:hypothetical protein
MDHESRTRWEPFRATGLLAAVAVPIGLCVVSAVSSSAAPSVISSTTYKGQAAFRLTDGRSEAVVVPALGRVMRYGLVDGPNVLWNSPPERSFKPGDWKNWGGDKVWPAPQSQWAGLAGPGWPPHPTFDGRPHQAEVLPASSGAAGTAAKPPRLRTIGPLMAGFGARVVREYYFDPATGDLVIEQALKKEEGVPLLMALWSVTQIPPPDAAFVPLNSDSPYKNNFYWFAGKAPLGTATVAVSPTLLRFKPSRGSYKLGADAPLAAVAAARDGLAFVLRSAKRPGQYPEGAEGSGFPVTIWNQDDAEPAARYVELEMMSPLTAPKPGEQIVSLMRWSLHRLPDGGVDRPEIQQAVEALLRAPLPSGEETR